VIFLALVKCRQRDQFERQLPGSHFGQPNFRSGPYPDTQVQKARSPTPRTAVDPERPVGNGRYRETRMVRIASQTRELTPDRALLHASARFPRLAQVYTALMSRRLIALLCVLVMGLQGPLLAYAAASTTAAAHCCPGQESGTAGSDCPPCPTGVLAGACCAGSPVFTAMLYPQISLLVTSSRLLLPESGSVPFATESPTPRFRPPIV